jgi:hypothetical protein
MRVTAWLAVIIGAVISVVMAITIWNSPVGPTIQAWGIGAATGIWSIDWIVFWGVVIYNVLVETGAFAHFRHWLVTQATADIRVQAILMAWALGALLEGLVGFGYPWAVVVPILVGLGVTEIDAIRVAAIGNNAQSPLWRLGCSDHRAGDRHRCRCSACLHRSAGSCDSRSAAAVDPHLPCHRAARPGASGRRRSWVPWRSRPVPTSQFLGPYLPA